MAKRGPKGKYTVEELEKKLEEYFNQCDENNKPYLVTSLSLFLDVDEQTMTNWETNHNGKFSELIKKAKKRIYNYAVEFLFTNNKTAAAIFNLKCNYSDKGWKDTQQIDVNQKTNIKFDFGFGEEDDNIPRD